MSASSPAPFRVAIAGASGYVGGELLRLLARLLLVAALARALLLHPDLLLLLALRLRRQACDAPGQRDGHSQNHQSIRDSRVGGALE